MLRRNFHIARLDHSAPPGVWDTVGAHESRKGQIE